MRTRLRISTEDQRRGLRASLGEGQGQFVCCRPQLLDVALCKFPNLIAHLDLSLSL